MIFEDNKRSVSIIMDRNHDGRLQESEYISAANSILNNAARSSAAGCGSAEKFLREISESGFEGRFAKFEREYASYFKGGIEIPQTSSLNALNSYAVHLNHQDEMGHAIYQSASLWPLLKSCGITSGDMQADIELEHQRRKRKTIAASL